MMRPSRQKVGSGQWTAKRLAFWLSTVHGPLTTRRGTTLSEVLVSTLVMSIGVVALATLFPISVLRSIQASQLTNAAILRYNAEAHLRTVPEIINIGTEWQPGQMYAAGDTVVPTATTRSRNPISAVFVCTAAGTTGLTEPTWTQASNDGQTLTDNSVTWTSVQLRNYVVDPLGYLLVDPTDGNSAFRGNGLTGAQQHFGNDYGNPFLFNNMKARTLNRFPAFGVYTPGTDADINELRAADLAVLPDSWTLQGESLDLANLTATSIELNGVDYQAVEENLKDPAYTSGIVIPQSSRLRIVLSNADGNLSVTRPLEPSDPTTWPNMPTASAWWPFASTGTGTRVTWQGSFSGFTPAKARVESLERRYSYLLSVRQRRSYSYVDVVVMFRRNYSIQDEQIFSCVFRKIDRGPDGQPGIAGTNDNKTGGTDEPAELGSIGSDDQPRNFCIVQYWSGGLKPFFKKGSYVCDVHNLRWYRVIDVAEGSSLAAVTPAGFEQDPQGTDHSSGTDNPCDSFVRLTLDQPVIEDTPFVPQSLTPQQFKSGGVVNANGTVGGALLMRGIVDVFPLRPRSTWEQ
jgi:Tfp pilus assembly protein PilV